MSRNMRSIRIEITPALAEKISLLPQQCHDLVRMSVIWRAAEAPSIRGQ